MGIAARIALTILLGTGLCHAQSPDRPITEFPPYTDDPVSSCYEKKLA